VAETEKEWYTQQEIASMVGVSLDRVRATVSTLSKAGVIKTQRDQRDSRYVLVHASSIQIVRQTLGG
jgi:DNA-binding MarR family transcriptional regulator